MTNFFLAPYSILQNYIGFKQLVVFKKSFTVSYFKRFNRLSIGFGAVLGLLLFCFAIGLEFSGIIGFSFNDHIPIILLLLLTGIIRMYSSSILSAFEAKTSLETLKRSNIYIISATVAILLFAVSAVDSVEAILLCIIVIWAIRCIVHRQLLLNQMKNADERHA
jgi:hypothetical protein